jgi:hypothetical protein
MLERAVRRSSDIGIGQPGRVPGVPQERGFSGLRATRRNGSGPDELEFVEAASNSLLGIQALV